MGRHSSTGPLTLNNVIAATDLRAADEWIEAQSRASVPDEVLTQFESEISAGIEDRSVGGTAKLFRLRMVLERFLACYPVLQREQVGRRGSDPSVSSSGLDQLTEYRFIQLLRKLEEDAVGPKFVGFQEPQALFARVLNFRGCRLAENGYHVEAIDHFTNALKLDNTFVPAHCNRARSWIERGEIDRAAEDCRRLTELDPDYGPGRETIALVDALARLQAAKGGSLLDLAHEHGVLELLRRFDRPRLPGELLDAIVNPAISVVAEEPSLKRPRTPAEWNHEGVLAGRRGEYEAAAAAFTNAIEADPLFANAWFNRGKTFKLWNRTREAIRDFQEAVRLDPSNDDAHLLLEETLEGTDTDMETEWHSSTEMLSGGSGLIDEAGIPARNLLPPRCSLILKDMDGTPPVGRLVCCPVELIAFCGDMLAIGSPCPTRRYGGTTPREYAIEQLRAADGLRKGGDQSAARSLYRAALRILWHQDEEEGAELVPALNGLGITYAALAKDCLRANLIEIRRNAAGGQAVPHMFHYLALRKGALRFAWNAKACHILALDRVAALSNVLSQARQVANLGSVERLLGNSDTAHRYFNWALSVHEALGEHAAADIDRRQLSESGSILGRIALVGNSA